MLDTSPKLSTEGCAKTRHHGIWQLLGAERTFSLSGMVERDQQQKFCEIDLSALTVSSSF
jgi:hypothetical protein